MRPADVVPQPQDGARPNLQLALRQMCAEVDRGMKISRAFLGKFCEVVWRDPCSCHVKSHTKDLSDIPKGRIVLATQRERGVIDDVTDGVVRIVHTIGTDSPLVPDPSTDLYVTWVDEALIESITVYAPVAAEGA